MDQQLPGAGSHGRYQMHKSVSQTLQIKAPTCVTPTHILLKKATQLSPKMMRQKNIIPPIKGKPAKGQEGRKN